MKWSVTDEEAIDAGFTHAASYWGIPVYIGNLEFHSVEPITVTTKYVWMEGPFAVVSFLELLFAPYTGGRFKSLREL